MAETSLVGRKARLVASQGAGKTSPVARQVSTPRITNTATTRQGLNIANIPSLPVSATGANPVLTVGGSGSTPAERLYPVTNDASPTSNALNYSLSGSGFGLDKFGQKVVEKDLTGLLQRQIDSGTPTTLVGHSMGAAMLFNTLQQMGEGNNPLFQKIFVDAPNLPWWMAPPRPLDKLFPTTESIHDANRNGIASDPNTVNWTDGNWLKAGGAPHSPWNFPNYPGSQKKMKDLQNSILSKSWNPMWKGATTPRPTDGLPRRL